MTAEPFREVEILVAVEQDKASALNALAQFGEPQVRTITDQYFTHSGVTFLKGDSGSGLAGSLRIRIQDGTATLTVKRDNFEGSNWLYSDEYNTPVLDVASMQSALEALQFTQNVSITTTRYAYHHGAFEIVLDDVQELGLMLEVEASSAGDNPLHTKQAVRAFLRSLPLKLGPEINEGKYELALRKTLIQSNSTHKKV